MREFRIRDHHEANKIRPYWCPGPLNVADFFSKTLQKNLFNINLKRLGMVGSFRDEVESRALHNDPPLQSSESSSCWHLRVTLTPERPSYHSCFVHLLHPAHQIQAYTSRVGFQKSFGSGSGALRLGLASVVATASFHS